MNREIRIYRYLTANPGWQARDKIMHWTGFPDPKRNPVSAYVEFQNDVMRLNARLSRLSKQVVRGGPQETYGVPEFYQIVSLDRVAA